jgi:alpha-1,2-mannosyltransferase
VQTGIDSFFYQKLVCVPWNIVAYNVFSGSSKGPNIYGTEPWHFYLRNLVLNFGIWLPLALLAIPLITIQHLLRKNPLHENSTSLLQTAAYASPFYLWLAIFTLQPHKEERFMYPAYPFLALNGALSLHTLLALLGTLPRPRLLSSPRLLLGLVAGALAASTAFSLLRTAGLAAGYAAPLRVYAPLAGLARAGDNVCLGKEWHRFPSSFFLPDGVRARFVRSEFRGLLPGAFREGGSAAGGWRRPATSEVPAGMNDENREDPGKYASHLWKCQSRSADLLKDRYRAVRVPRRLADAVRAAVAPRAGLRRRWKLGEGCV